MIYNNIHFNFYSLLIGTAESEKQQFIKKTFEDAIFRSLYPRMEITIDIQVLSDDGSTLAAAINAVQLALMNSGISMKYMVAALSMCYKYDQLYLDPSLSEEQVFIKKIFIILFILNRIQMEEVYL